MTATFVKDAWNSDLRHRVGWPVASFVVVMAIGLTAFHLAWNRFPWSDQPTSYHACGTTYWQSNLDASRWARTIGRSPVPGTAAAPLRRVGQTGGWLNARGIYAYKHPGTHRNDGCGYATFLRLGADKYMVYGDSGVEFTIHG